MNGSSSSALRRGLAGTGAAGGGGASPDQSTSFGPTGFAGLAGFGGGRAGAFGSGGAVGVGVGSGADRTEADRGGCSNGTASRAGSACRGPTGSPSTRSNGASAIGSTSRTGGRSDTWPTSLAGGGRSSGTSTPGSGA